MTYLPDVNVWMGFILEDHVHGRVARRFINDRSSDTFALCRVTEMAILRLLTNARVTGPENVLTPRAAWTVLKQLRDADNVVIAAEPAGLESTWELLTASPAGSGSYWTDSYLASFAIAARFKLVTFDRGFSSWPGLAPEILKA